VALLAATQVSGHKGWFSAVGSYDPEGEAIQCAWQFGDGSSYSGSALRATHTYQASGEYTVTLTVTDAQGASSTATLKVSVNNTPLLSAPYALKIFQSWYLFYASAYDTDGSIAEYVWNSSRDGFLGRSPFLIKRLSRGYHTVTVRAKDNLGAWSAEKAVPVFVN
jgi:PKD repeat protein